MNYFLVLDVLVLIVLAVCLLGGLIRGFKKSLRKLIALAIPTICLFIFLGPITNAVMNIEVDLGKINNIVDVIPEEYTEEFGFITEEKAPVSEITRTPVPFFCSRKEEFCKILFTEGLLQKIPESALFAVDHIDQCKYMPVPLSVPYSRRRLSSIRCTLTPPHSLSRKYIWPLCFRLPSWASVFVRSIVMQSSRLGMTSCCLAQMLASEPPQ